MPDNLEETVKVNLRFNTEDNPRGIALNIPHFIHILPFDETQASLAKGGSDLHIYHDESRSKVKTSTLVPPSFFEKHSDFWVHNSLPYKLDDSLRSARLLEIDYAAMCELMSWEQWLTEVYETSLSHPNGLSGIQRNGDKVSTIIHVSGVHDTMRIQGLYNLPYTPITRRAKEFLKEYLFGRNTEPVLIDRGKNLLESISSRHQLAFRLGVIPYAALLQKMVTKDFINNLAEGDYLASDAARAAKTDIDAFFDSKNWTAGESPGFSVANTSELVAEDGTSQVYKIRLFLPGNNNIDIAAKQIDESVFNPNDFELERVSLERLVKLQELPTAFYYSHPAKRLLLTRFLNGDRLDERQPFFGKSDLEKINSRLANLHTKGYSLRGKSLEGTPDPWKAEHDYSVEFRRNISFPLSELGFSPDKMMELEKSYFLNISMRLDSELRKGTWNSLVHGDLHPRQVIFTPYGEFLVDAGKDIHYGLAQVDKKRINSYYSLSKEEERIDAIDYISKRLNVDSSQVSGSLVDDFLQIGNYAHIRNELMIAANWAFNYLPNSEDGKYDNGIRTARKHFENAINSIEEMAAGNKSESMYKLRDLLIETLGSRCGYGTTTIMQANELVESTSA